MKYDVVVVGAGLAGAVMAERAASAGKSVLVIEKRDHIAGNCYDYRDENGIIIHKYGPHAFHTEQKKVFDYLSRFTDWHPYKHKVTALVKGKNVILPVNYDTIDQLFGKKDGAIFKEKLLSIYPEGSKVFIADIIGSDDEVVRKYARIVYEEIYLNYSKKQWGVDPKELDPMVLKRVPLWMNREPYYFPDKYQAMPKEGYTAMVEKMLESEKIEVVLGKDYKEIEGKVSCGRIVHTGAIDGYFGDKYGHLPYRSLRFEYETHDAEYYQRSTSVNYPGTEPYTRITEFKHFLDDRSTKTVIAREYPEEHVPGKNIPFYPMPLRVNYDIYNKYAGEALKLKNVTFIGRLAEYKYYNMDQVVLRALEEYERIGG